MALWVRFERAGEAGFGTLGGETIAVHRGDMFGAAEATGENVALGAVRLMAPVRPPKMLALWNNFRALGQKLGLSAPLEPLWFIKASSSYADPDAVVRRPPGYDGKVVFEGELGVVIGRTLRGAGPEEAEAGVFGYTCVNDITASDILNKDASFAQWTRAKSYDGFSPLGPAILTGARPETLSVRTVLNGSERQNYPVSDMVFSVPELVSRLSRDVTLTPGDVICCGTSVGVGAMREARNTVEVTIEGVGTLRTVYENE